MASHVPDNWLDSISPFVFAPDVERHTALLPCLEYFDLTHVVTAVTNIDFRGSLGLA